MTKAAIFCAASAAALAGIAHGGESDADVGRLRAVIASNSVDQTTDCRYYRAWYVDQCTARERKSILGRNVAAHRRLLELRPGDAELRAVFGRVLVIGGMYGEAEKELRSAIGSGGLRADKLVVAKWLLAECLWRKGDRKGAKAEIAEVAGMEKPETGAWQDKMYWDKCRYLHRAWTDPDGDIDVFTLPHSTDGRPFPTPQKAKYGEAKVSLAKVEIDMRDARGEGNESRSQPHVSRDPRVSRDDPIVRLLKRKLSRFGSKFASGGTTVELSLSPDAPVGKPQGYSLDVANGSVRVQARTRLGLTYGVVSFLQCVDRGGLSIRELSIRDWPRLEKRGILNHWEADQLECSLFMKMSSVVHHIGGKGEWTVLFSSLEREKARLYVSRFRDFGLSFYWSERRLTVEPVLPFSSPRTRAMHLAWMKCAAMIGADVCFELDDSRFYPVPLHPLDVKAAGSATNLDSKYITGLYREIKAEFPEFKMMFGTPFYFGPDGGLSKQVYPEDRTEYLKSHKEFLDPEIEVYWSGPRVKSYGFTAEKIDWMANLIGRKPTVYHNSDCRGRHNFVQYGADVSGYKTDHCPETFDLIAGFYQNTSRLEESGMAGQALDWCWNPEAHVAETAARRVVEMLEGPGVFEIIAGATPTLSYFDRYAFGVARSELFTEDPDDLDRKVAECEAAWTKAVETGKNKARFVRGFDRPGLEWARKLAKQRRNPPGWLVAKRDAELANTKFAREDVGYDPEKGDLFFPAELMSGGQYYNGQGDYSKRGPRGIKYVNVGDSVSVRFSCEPFPPEMPPRLYVTGMAFKKEPPVIDILVNGRSIYRGEAFEWHYFKPFEIEIPVYALRRESNKVEVKTVSPEEQHWRKPMIHYIVIKKRQE